MITLYSYQREAACLLHEKLLKYPAVLDASDTGTGKTFSALQVALDLKSPCLVLCPKAVVTPWSQISEAMGVPLLGIINIEKLKTGKTPWLKVSTREKKNARGNSKKVKNFAWNLSPGTLIIWDECQNASSYNSQNSTLLALTKAFGLKVLALSATVADNPLKLKSLGYLLGLHKFQDHYSWCLKHACSVNPWGGLVFTRNLHRAKEAMLRIHKKVFPEHGVRNKIEHLKTFPENAIFADAYDIDTQTSEINKIYQKLEKSISDKTDNPLVLQLRAFQKIEFCKLPLLKDMTIDLLEEGKSVVIFVNYRESLAYLETLLTESSADIGRCSLIFGGQSKESRNQDIEDFQSNRTRVILCMIQAGGVGISLHDTDGSYPRVSLINPTYHAVQLKQALGRIHRAGGKSKCVQRLIFTAKTIEEKTCRSVKKKLNNLALLNDGDLTDGFNFTPSTDTQNNS